MSENNNITTLNHPLCDHNMSLLRDKTVSCDVFRNALKRIASLLIYEATKELPLKCINIETPITECEVKKIDESVKIIFAPILRAGLALSDAASEILPEASVQHIGMYRDEVTLKPVWYYDKTPVEFDNPNDIRVFILDPMLATGNSAKASVELFLKRGIALENIIFVSLISAPEGISALTSKYENIKIITGKIDTELNSRGYIVPGLGDAGDRLFNTFDK